MAFLLDHRPPKLHLLISSRTDPLLSLPRLRACGQLTELRTEDLRFSADEAADFSRQVMRLSLSAEVVSALEARTEGWIAGLQMAALSIQGLGRDNHAAPLSRILPATIVISLTTSWMKCCSIDRQIREHSCWRLRFWIASMHRCVAPLRNGRTEV